VLLAMTPHSQLCSVIFCEATAIYGVIVAIILQTKIDEVPRNADGTFLSAAVFSGYAVFASGCTVGFANLACGCARLTQPLLHASAHAPVCARTCSHAPACLPHFTPSLPGCAWASSAAAAR
jgi:hypothetical protein